MNRSGNVFSRFKRTSSRNPEAQETFGRGISRNGARTLFFFVLAATILTMPFSIRAGQGDESQTPPVATSAAPAILKDYVYGYAPVTMAVTRAIQTAVPDNSEPGQAPVNQFAYQKTLTTPSDHLVSTPRLGWT